MRTGNTFVLGRVNPQTRLAECFSLNGGVNTGDCQLVGATYGCSSSGQMSTRTVVESAVKPRVGPPLEQTQAGWWENDIYMAFGEWK